MKMNIRGMENNEIVLCPKGANINEKAVRAKAIIEDLNKKKWNYTTFHSTTQYYIILEVNKLEEFSREIRQRTRLGLISLFKCNSEFRYDKERIPIVEQTLNVKNYEGINWLTWIDDTIKDYLKTIEIPETPLELQHLVLLHLGSNKPKASELIVRFMLTHERIYTTRDDDNAEIWMYQNGIYVPEGRTYIKEFCRTTLETAYTTHFCNQVIAKVEVDTYIDQKKLFINEDVNKVPVQNGIVNIDTLELEEFSSGLRFFNKLPVVFDPKAICPAIQKFFKEVLKSKDDIKVLQELFGYLLYRDLKVEKAFMFTGSGRNGKGKTVELMKRFLGSDNCANITLQARLS